MTWGHQIDIMQDEIETWAQKNFPSSPSEHHLLVVAEELGELAHAHVKSRQGIRMEEDHEKDKFDAVGDIVIALMAYCSSEGLSLRKALQKTWQEVKQREWKKEKS